MYLYQGILNHPILIFCRYLDLNDKILCSTYAQVRVTYSPITSKKTTYYSWDTHLLLTFNGIALMVAKQVSQKGAHYVPWGLVSLGKPRTGITLWVSRETADFKFPILLTMLLNKKVEKIHYFEYFDKFKPIMEQRIREMEKKIEDNLKSLDSLDFVPNYEEYINYFDRVPKDLYKKVRKKIIKERKK